MAKLHISELLAHGQIAHISVTST